jgi:hypothetical protein
LPPRCSRCNVLSASLFSSRSNAMPGCTATAFSVLNATRISASSLRQPESSTKARALAVCRWALVSRLSSASVIDYGFLYATAPDTLGGWQIQSAFVWRDMGTTQFALGNVASTNRRLQYLPSNMVLGLGIGTPKFSEGIRGALRLEYSQWNRPVPAYEKVAVSAELRFPVVASLSVGFAGKRLSGGLALRFPGIQVDLASYSELIGNAAEAAAVRSLILELKSVF